MLNNAPQQDAWQNSWTPDKNALNTQYYDQDDVLTENPSRESYSVAKPCVTVPLDTFNRGRIADLTLKGAPKVLDLFAGAGGMSLGFKAAGYDIIGACEIDAWASDTIRYNFPEKNVVCSDIKDISNSDFLSNFKDVDVIIGGPPCQGFSVANNSARKIDDPRNSLFREFVRAISIYKPSLVVFENVYGLTKKKTPSGEFYLDIIRAEIEALGYHTYAQVLEAQNYGVPQIRPRLIIVASRAPLTCPHPNSTHGDNKTNAGLHPYTSIWSAISDMPIIHARQGAEVMEYDRDADNDLQELLRAGSDFIYNNKAMNHSTRLVSRFSMVKWGGSGADVEGEFGARKRNSDTAGAKFDQNNRRNFPDRVSHTLPASFYANFIHPFENRNYTPREGARLQTFPDWYRFSGKPTVVSQKLLKREERGSEMHLCQYNQIGNAVPPLMAYTIANNLKNQV